MRVVKCELPKIIYIIGPEGVGKSTLANFMLAYLKRNNLPLREVEIRGYNLFMYYLRELLLRVHFTDNYASKLDKTLVFVNSFREFIRRVVRLWILMEFIAFIFAHIVKVCLLRLLGYNIILTGHVIEFLVDMYYMGFICRNITRLHHLMTYMLLRMVKQFDVVIYLDADYKALIGRYRMRGSYIQPRSWITFYRLISKKLMGISSSYSGTQYYIDTTFKRSSEVFVEVVKLLRYGKQKCNESFST